MNKPSYGSSAKSDKEGKIPVLRMGNIQNGKIFVKSGCEMGFLEVLDRRRYRLELIDGQAENFKASSRSKI